MSKWTTLVQSREEFRASKLGISNSGQWTLKEYDIVNHGDFPSLAGLSSIWRCNPNLAGCHCFNRFETSPICYPHSICVLASPATRRRLYVVHIECGLWWEKKVPFKPQSILGALYGRHAKERRDMAFGMWAILKQGGIVDLPSPKHSDEIGEIYHMPTTSLNMLTQSSDILFFAALQSMTG